MLQNRFKINKFNEINNLVLLNQPITFSNVYKQIITYRSAKKMCKQKNSIYTKKKLMYPLPYRHSNNNTSKKNVYMLQMLYIYHSINYKHFGGYKKYVFIYKILISSVL